MQVIDRQTVAEKLIGENLSELHRVRERIRIYEKKYGMKLEQFRERIEQEEENFEHFDDYIDWKAAETWRDEIETRIEELRNGAFRVVGC